MNKKFNLRFIILFVILLALIGFVILRHFKNSTKNIGFEEAKFKKITAITTSGRYRKNHVILKENNKEIIIDESKNWFKSKENVENSDKVTGESYDDVLEFFQPEFSPLGSYLVYTVHFSMDEKWVIRIFDIRKKKKIIDLPGQAGAFTPDEKYFYTWGLDEFGGNNGGIIYMLPDFKVEYDLFNNKNIRWKASMNFVARYDNKRLSIIYILSDDKYEEPNPQEKQIIEYSLKNKKAHILKSIKK